MKKLIACLFLSGLCVTMVAPSAHALGAYGIMYLPDEGDDDGWGLGLKKGRNITPLISIEPRFSFTSFDSADLWSAEVAGLAHLGMFYGGVGVGYYFLTGDAPLENTLGWFLLGGVDIGLGGLGVFGELKYQFLEPDIESSIVDASADLNGIAIHAGVKFNLLGL